MRGTRNVSRRQLVGGLAAVSTVPLWAALGLAASTTSYTFKLGELEISVFSDGHLTIPTRSLARNVDEAELKTWLAPLGQPGRQ